MNRRAIPSGALGNGPAVYSAKQYNRADPSTPFPAGSILKSANAIDALAEVSPTVAVAQATIDFLKVFFAVLLLAVTGIRLGIAFAYWIFC